MKKRNVMILVILLVIGFASVSTTLILNGNIGIGLKNDDFDVIFVEAALDGKSANASISEDKKSITFATKRLRELNESSELEYKVKNTSTQYGANVTLVCNTYGNENIEITGMFDNKDIPLTTPIEMEAQEIKNGILKAEIVKVYAGEDASFDVTCTITATPTEKENVTDYVPTIYKDPILNGADPVLTTASKTRSTSEKNLIPVTIKNDGTVTYTDVNEKWYDYENKEWANAVILIDNTAYEVGDTIPEENIESYFVWIPRYKYLIFDEGNYTEAIEEKPVTSIAQEIKIEFENKNITSSKGRKKGEWLTHPAFTNFDVNGLWVGKFETGYKGATSTNAAEVNAVDVSKVVVKPNVHSWRGNTVSNIFKTAYNYNRELDSHMMKNTEWGAVAYLSHSKYGINTEVRVNNNSAYLTGYAAVDGTDQSSYPGTVGTDSSKTLAYNTTTGYKASTTGNITGIYDMSGGSWEYVAAYMPSTSDISGFTDSELTSYAKYLDVYPSDSILTSYNKRILGDATGEMGPFYYYADKDGGKRYHNNWYGDHSGFVASTRPWFHRGGGYDDGVHTGLFYFNGFTGGIDTSDSSRLVLAP